MRQETAFVGCLPHLGSCSIHLRKSLKTGYAGSHALCGGRPQKGEVSPVFEDYRNEGYCYRLKSYMDIHTRQEYPKELIQPEIKPENRTGTIEQLAQNVEAVEKQVQLMGVKNEPESDILNWVVITQQIKT